VLAAIDAWRGDTIVASWSITPREWRYLPECRTPSHVLDTCRQRVDGIDAVWDKGILLMHDWPTVGDHPSITDGLFAPLVCATLMERYLQVVAAKGLSCVRMSDCDWGQVAS